MGTAAFVVIIVCVMCFGFLMKWAMDNQDRKDTEKYSHYSSGDGFIPQELSQLSAKCSNCGAVIPPSIEGRVIAHCPYCGNALPDMKPFIEEAARIRQAQHRHDMELEAMDREIQKTDREIRRERIHNFPAFVQLIRYIIIGLIMLPIVIMLLKDIFR